MPWPIACRASSGIRFLSSVLAFSCSRCASRVWMKMPAYSAQALEVLISTTRTLTAETVIGALEDAEDYKAFDIADYDVQSPVERELVLRLANLLWRLRRAMTMETGLFEIQADYLREFRQGGEPQTKSPDIIYARFERTDSAESDSGRASHDITNGMETPPSSGPGSVDPAIDLARCFLRLANLPSYALDRLSRYEAIVTCRLANIPRMTPCWSG
jgi:hypothetical protein